MILEVLRFCQRLARYDGPKRSDAVKQVRETYTQCAESPLAEAFDLGYKRGYADAGIYIADWIEEETD